MIGIYKITNLINNKCYIGQSIDIQRRWNKHKNSNLSYPLYNAFRLYGLENFLFEVLEECDRAELNEKELFYIKKYNSCNPENGYNQTLNCGSIYGHGIVFTYDLIESLFDDLLLTDIDKEQLAKKYKCSERTITDVNAGRVWHKDSINYPIRKYWIGKDGKHYSCLDTHICPRCGKPKHIRSILCMTCSKQVQRKVNNRPDAKTLAQEIVNSSFTAVGRIYGVSDNTIRKWCKFYNIPVKKVELIEWLKNN